MADTTSRYARALFEIARDANALAPVCEILHSFKEAFANSKDFQTFVASPKLSKSNRMAFFDSLLKSDSSSAVSEATKIVRTFFKLLVDKQRVGLFFDILTIFDEMVDKSNGVVVAYATSAIPLSNDDKAELSDILLKSEGKEIALIEKIDPSLLGGLVVRIGSRQIDTSLRSKLNSIKYALKEVS